MNCPKCRASMEKVAYHSIVVDRCSQCKGLWFDMLEEERLKAVKGAEQIDTGDPEVGRKYDTIDKIECPKCHTIMGRMVDSNQPHIWYESCDVCYGVFFDAGEFRDYKVENILDVFKDLLRKPRQ